MEKRLLTVEELAKELNVSTRSVYRYIKDEKIKVQPIGLKLFIHRRAMFEFLANERKKRYGKN